MKVNIIYDETSLTIVPSFAELEDKLLTFKEKKMQMGMEGLKSFKQKQTLYDIIPRADGIRACQTWPGLWKRVWEWLLEKGHEPVWIDLRKPFPEPRYDRMVGFRLQQRPLLVEALQRGMSGLLEAPTRYGKTTLIINTLRAFPSLTTVVAVPGVDLIEDLYDKIKKSLPEREVVMIGGGSKTKYPSDDITVCSMDSLDKCDFGRTRLVLIDEPHAAVTAGRLPDVMSFKEARKIAFGATPTGRYDGRDIIIEGLIGPILARRTFTEAVAEGAICPIRVAMLMIPFRPPEVNWPPPVATKILFVNNGLVSSTLQWISRELLPPDWQTLMFIQNEKAADHFLKVVGEEGTIAMAKKMTKKERKHLMALMQSNDIKRCLASNIYSQGVTFSDLRCVINLAGGGPYTGTIQKPGRLAEIRPGKKCGVMIDFLFKPVGTPVEMARKGGWDMMLGCAWQRYKVYKAKGYDVDIIQISDRAGLAEWFKQCL